MPSKKKVVETELPTSQTIPSLVEVEVEEPQPLAKQEADPEAEPEPEEPMDEKENEPVMMDLNLDPLNEKSDSEKEEKFEPAVCVPTSSFLPRKKRTLSVEVKQRTKNQRLSNLVKANEKRLKNQIRREMEEELRQKAKEEEEEKARMRSMIMETMLEFQKQQKKTPSKKRSVTKPRPKATLAQRRPPRPAEPEYEEPEYVYEKEPEPTYVEERKAQSMPRSVAQNAIPLLSGKSLDYYRMIFGHQ